MRKINYPPSIPGKWIVPKLWNEPEAHSAAGSTHNGAGQHIPEEMDAAGVAYGVVPIRKTNGGHNEELLDLLDRYPETLKNDVSMLAKFSNKNRFADYAGRIVLDDNNEAIFNFGKHKGKN